MHSVDRVVFVFPKDWELQFVAISAVQNFVHVFKDKMTVSAHMPDTTYELQYDIQGGSPELFILLRDSYGLRIDQNPVPLTLDEADAVFDLSEEKLAQFSSHSSIYHVHQIYGAIVGVGCYPIPVLRQVKPKMIAPFEWLYFKPREFPLPVEFVDGEVSGIVGGASWVTYLAASMGLPVIELLPPGRGTAWLSKFVNLGYRSILHCDDPSALIETAKRSIERQLVCLVPAQETPVA